MSSGAVGKGQVRRVPAFDLKRQVRGLEAELAEAMRRVLSSGRYVLGREVEAFEREVASYLGAKHGAGVASGTDALLLALKALGIGPGDRVLTTPFTFFATASAILLSGAEPVFADIDPVTFNLDPEQARIALEGGSPVHGRIGIDPATIRAIVPVHLYGQPADLEPLVALAEDHGLFVVEDAAQAMGAEYRGRKAGTEGDLGCFSFFPTKNLGGFGDGGLVVTGDESLDDRVRLMRAHGARRRYHHEVVGTNSRLDALQAALLRSKLPHLDEWIDARQANARGYARALQAVDGIRVPQPGAGRTHTYHLYTVRLLEGRRDDARDFLASRGVETTVYYPLAVHLQPALSHLGYRPGDFEHAEAASHEVLSLPMFPELRGEEVEFVADALRGYLDASSGYDGRATRLRASDAT